MPGDLCIRDWSKHNATWFAAVQSQKKMMFMILVLIIAVAAFNLVATLVDDGHRQAGRHRHPAHARLLAALDHEDLHDPGRAGRHDRHRCAALRGGVLVALNIDVIIPFIERLFGVQFLSKDIYLISTLPSDLRWPDVVGDCGVSRGLAFLATLYPSFAPRA